MTDKKKAKERESEFGIVSARDLLSGPDVPQVPIIKRFLYEGDTFILAGQPEQCKSLVALEAGMCITSGADFLDTLEVCQIAPVLYVLTEGKRSSLRSRIFRMEKAVGLNRDKFHILYEAGLALNTAQGFSLLMKYLDIMKEKAPASFPKVIILDSLYTCVVGDTNLSDTWMPFLVNMRTLKDKYHCTLILIHHAHKEKFSDKGKVRERPGAQMSGHACLWANVESGYIVTRTSDKHVKLTHLKDRDALMEHTLELILVQPDPLFLTMFDDGSTQGFEIIKWHVEQASMKGMGIPELLKKTKLSRDTVNKGLRYWCALGEMIRINPGHNPARYGMVRRK